MAWPKAWSLERPHQPPLAPFWEPLTSVQDDQGGSELLSRQQPVGKIMKPGWSCVGMAAKARHGGFSPSGPSGSKLGGRGSQG